MGRAYWRPGDGRSRRRDRVPVDMRLLGRMLPARPFAVAEYLPQAMPLRQLHSLFEQARLCIEQYVPELRGALAMSNGHYPELLSVAFGGHKRELLSPGTYIITDSSAAQRVLYVGSSVDGAVRARLISHLYEDGRVYLSQRAYRDAVSAMQAGAFTSEHEAELVLRHALFGANRWSTVDRHRTDATARAAWLVSYGAFDIAVIATPPSHSVLARLLERYLIEAHLWHARQL
ncbi:MAG: hypothetical protein HXY24_08860, partial [Rubrivivax sp.]|nr:hypothetical protein [Rubrivivax sp.]